MNANQRPIEPKGKDFGTIRPGTTLRFNTKGVTEIINDDSGRMEGHCDWTMGLIRVVSEYWAEPSIDNFIKTMEYLHNGVWRHAQGHMAEDMARRTEYKVVPRVIDPAVVDGFLKDGG